MSHPIRIERIEIFHAAMPLKAPFTTAYGSDDAIHSVFVRLDGGGLQGWGEACPLQFPTYSPEWASGVFHVVRDVLAPRVVGRTLSSGEELNALYASIKGNTFAKGAVDLAWWDLLAKAQGRPLWQAIGGRKNTVEAGADFGVMPHLDQLLEAIAGAVRDGFTRVKLKYRPGWDLDMIAAVKAAFPHTVFHVDCNSGYTLADLAMFKKLDQYGLAMIEQPLSHDDLIDHATLQRQIATPICLDESITSPDKARKAAQIGACRWINIKASRVGGITNSLRVHDIARDAGIPCWIGSMLESAVGASFCLALATLPNVRYPSDLFPTSRFYHQDLATPELFLSGPSEMKLSDAPGVGATPDPERLRRLTVASATVGPQ